MPFTFLQPISSATLADSYKPQQLGYLIRKHTEYELFPDLEDVKIAFFCIENSQQKSDDFRKHFYALYSGNWHFPIADLGNLIQSHSASDTYFAIKELVSTLLKKQIISMVIGGEHHFTYGLYRAFDALEQMVNLVSVDARFDFGNEQELFAENSYMSRILSEDPVNLNDFTNLGYQSFYNAQEELDLMDKMFFEAHRLGNLVADMTLAEPAMRDADIVSIDMTSIQAKDVGIASGNVNGFSNREICTLARYAGISSNVQVFGVFDVPPTELAYQLLAQMMWYFIEGYNFRVRELPVLNDENYTKYTVLIDDLEVTFFKSNHTGRWWLKPYTESSKRGTNHLPLGLIPCNPTDYTNALKGDIPEKWWKVYRKSIL